MKGRPTCYASVEKMQMDLDEYLDLYNIKRPHRGRKMNGKTPFTIIKAGIPKALKANPANPRSKQDQKVA